MKNSKKLSSIVRAAISSNGTEKNEHLDALRSLVGCEMASKLIDMKVASQFKKRPLSVHERLALLGATIHKPEMVNGKASVKIFGRYVALFNY